MVVTEHYLSAEAGLRILHGGGNAFDAAIAATLAEGVLNPHMNTFGGELSALGYVAAERRVFAVNGDTVAPRAATIEWFEKRRDRPHSGGRRARRRSARDAARAPDDARALRNAELRRSRHARARARRGRIPAPSGLRGPGPAHPLGDFSLAGIAELFRTTWPSSAAVYLPDGRLPDVGERMRNPDLARTFRRLIAAEERARSTRADRRHRGGDRCLLSRRDRRDDRRARRGGGRAPRARGPARLPKRDRADRVARLPRLHRPQVRPLEPGAGVPAAARPARRLRPREPRARQRGLHPRPRRGGEARLRGPRAILRRPALRGRAARRIALGNATRAPDARSSIPAARRSNSVPAIRAAARRSSRATRSSRRGAGAAAPCTSRWWTARATWPRSLRAAPGFPLRR